MNTQLETIRQNLNAIAEFLENNPINLPEEMLKVSVDNTPLITLHLSNAPNQHGREKVLSAIGDAWGRQGWTATLNYRQDAYDWRKEFDLPVITLVIFDAEPAEKKPTGFPVPPQKFPVMLEDRGAGPA